MAFIRYATSTNVKVGPFVDDTDAKTAETGLTIAQADVRLSKAGGAFAQMNADPTALTHDENGWYGLTLDATDTGTLGELIVAVHESGALPVFHAYQVIPQATYDSLYASGADLAAEVVTSAKDQNRRGTAQSGGASTIQLAAGDAEADDYFNGSVIVLMDGTGTDSLTVVERTRLVTDYDNATNTAAVDAAWDTAPSSDTVYLIVGS